MLLLLIPITAINIYIYITTNNYYYYNLYRGLIHITTSTTTTTIIISRTLIMLNPADYCCSTIINDVML